MESVYHWSHCTFIRGRVYRARSLSSWLVLYCSCLKNSRDAFDEDLNLKKLIVEVRLLRATGRPPGIQIFRERREAHRQMRSR